MMQSDFRFLERNLREPQVFNNSIYTIGLRFLSRRRINGVHRSTFSRTLKSGLVITALDLSPGDLITKIYYEDKDKKTKL